MVTTSNARRSSTRWWTLTAIAVTAVVSLACNLGSGGGSTTGSAAAPTPTGPTASPSPTGPPLPAGWLLCTNATWASSMGYPGTWHQPVPPLPAYQPCSAFQPFAFTIPAASDYHLIALNARQHTETVATVMADYTNPEFFTVVSTTSVTAAGHPARRFEVSSTGAGLDEAGTRTYGYAIDRAGHAFVVWTIAQPGVADYPSWKTVVDQAVASLTLS